MMNVYNCTEMLEAATLKALGIRLVEIVPGKRVTLRFDDSDNRASEIVNQHINGGVSVNSADMASALQWVKDRIFSTRRQAGLD